MNRRDFMKTLSIGAGATVVGAEFANQTIAALAAPQAALDAQADPIHRALNRLSFGPRPGQVEAVRKQGLENWIAAQLDYEKIDNSASEARLGNYPTLDMTPAELVALVGKQEGDVVRELDSATVLRAIYNPRDLFEVVTLFWSEHFSIWHQKESDRLLKTLDDRDVIRANAFTNYRQLLGASAKSPAMLVYLDNAKSDLKHPNENYAREVMELHTITIGKYTETDVKEVARCFTGWTLYGRAGKQPGEFYFNPKMHDNAAKTVLGKVIPAGGGQQDGETVLDMLALHPGTAELIAYKLAMRFVTDTPPDSIVQAAKDAFLKSGGSHKTVLKTIFASPEFANAGPKYKRPYEFLISLFRSLDVQIDTFNLALLVLLRNMGHLPFDWITPDGYSDYAANWEANMLTRWNTAINALGNKLPGVKVDLNKIAQSQGVTIAPEPVINFFAQHIFGRPMTQDESDAIFGYLNKNGKVDLTTDAGRRRINEAIALMYASPAFMYR